MSFKIVFLCFVLQLVAGSIVKQIRNVEECYNKTTTARPQHAQFSTKTLYELVKGTLQDSQISDCQPAKIWLLVRHATVYPVDLNIDIEALKSLKESILDLDPHPLCEEDIDLLRTWELNDNIAVQAGHLTKEGLSEMGALAHDYKGAFQHLFESTDKVVFRHTTEQRNNESFSAFATALFDRGDLEGNFSHDQFMFEFYKHCAEWNDKNAKLSESQSVLSQFQESVLFKDTINEISVRLGLSDSENKWETIKNVWDMCRIDKALVVENLSPWCAAFTPAHVNVLEYHEDIELYYKTGWGEEMNSRLACTTINDLINHLNTESSDETSPKAIVSFADATTVQLFITALGTHKDAVQASNDSIPDERMWKSSKMSPFASNIAVVKYDCPTAAKVKLFLNQKLLTPDREWCTEDGVCEFNEFIDHYSEYTSGDCKKYFCDSKTSSKSKIENEVGVFAVAISLMLVYLH